VENITGVADWRSAVRRVGTRCFQRSPELMAIQERTPPRPPLSAWLKVRDVLGADDEIAGGHLGDAIGVIDGEEAKAVVLVRSLPRLR